MAEVVQLKKNGELKYLKTHVKAVEGLTEELDKLQNKTAIEKLWDGGNYPTENQTIYPTKKLSECATGWLVVFRPFVSSTGAGVTWNYTTCFIPKSGVNLYAVNVYTSKYTWATKGLNVFDDRIVGLKDNAIGDAKEAVLCEIWEV